MDIIATGVSSTSAEKIKNIGNIIKKIYSDYKDRVKKNGILYFNLFEYVNSKMSEGQQMVSINKLTLYRE